MTTNPLARLGDEGQWEPFRTVTRCQKEEDSEETGEAEERRTLSGNTRKEDEDNEKTEDTPIQMARQKPIPPTG
ncbi:hypothetical protein NDU88_004382 [Pleurodeles waltl]|uniref:Uncharacterized protein n=1 Tax=Pleurodeles waltl TaxID=8319 RepID=A0AAV7WRQ5_PLEWA|nr:hypothetical protein NDU88_004382 [Pleurodeles waltl]